MTPVAQWPPGFQGTESWPSWLTEGRGWGGEEAGQGGGGWKTESEGEISSLGRMRERLEGWREGGGGGLIGGGDKLDFRSRLTSHNSPNKT